MLRKKLLREHTSRKERLYWTLERLAAVCVVLIGGYVMLSLGSRMTGDFESTMVVYFLGAAIMIPLAQAVFFRSKIREQLALRLAIVAIVAVAVWLSILQSVL